VGLFVKRECSGSTAVFSKSEIWRALPSNQGRQRFCWSVSSLEAAAPTESPSGYRYAAVRLNYSTGLAGSARVTAVVPHVEAWSRPGQRAEINGKWRVMQRLCSLWESFSECRWTCLEVDWF
jgi:hypothetical protein